MKQAWCLQETTAPIPKLYNDMLQEVQTLQTENVINEELISNIQTLPNIKTSCPIYKDVLIFGKVCMLLID